jgi:hypothetical protein
MTAVAVELEAGDVELLHRITASKDALLFTQLFEASTPRPYESPAEPWARLLWLTAKYTQDPPQLLRIMAASSCKLPATARPGAAKRMAESAAYGAAMNRDPDATGAERWKLYTVGELLALPEPAWLLQDVLFAGGLTLLYGLKGSYKSFVALAWAAAVADGHAWLGRTSEAGDVVYVVAEGKGFFRRRLLALLAHLKLTEDDLALRCVTVPVNLFDGEAPAFAAHVRAQLDGPPALVVFDTLARSAAGAEENSAKDMGLVVAAAQVLQQDGPAVLLVHHTGKDGLDARGSGALKNAADMVLKLTATGKDTVTLTWENTKDLAEPDPLGLVLEPSAPSLVVTAGALVEPAAKDRRPTLEEQRSALVKLCWDDWRTKDELSAETGRSARWLESELPVLIAAKRLKARKRAGKGGPLEYLATRTPVDTI